MTQNEAKIRVRLDTSQAKSEMKSLSAEGKAAASRIGAGVRRALSGTVRSLGLGAGIGAGIAAVRAPLEGGVGDVFSEAVGGLGYELENWALGDGAQESRAKRAARTEVNQAFRYQIGQTGYISDQARSFYEGIKERRLVEEKGAYLINTDKDMRGPGVMEIIDRIATRLGEEMRGALSAFARTLPFVGGF